METDYTLIHEVHPGEKYHNRKVIEKAEFKYSGTFQSMYAANKWLYEKNYDTGSSCAMLPTPITKGNYINHNLPQKWKNFTEKQKNSVSGVMTGDLREGPVFVYLFE